MVGPIHSSADALAPESAARYQGHVEGATALVFQDEAAWNRVLRPGTPKEFLPGWLALQCRLMAHARLGVLILREDARGKLVPAAQWPEHAAFPPSSRKRRAGQPRTPRSVLCRGGSAGAANAVAHPIFVGDELRGVAAVEVTATSEADLTESMRQLQWGVRLDRTLAGGPRQRIPARTRRWRWTYSRNACVCRTSMQQRWPPWHSWPTSSDVSRSLLAWRGGAACTSVPSRIARISVPAPPWSVRSSGLWRKPSRSARPWSSEPGSSTDGPAIPAHETLSAREEVAGHSLITVPVKGEHGPDAAFTFQFPAGRSVNAELTSLLAACAVPAGGVLTRSWLEQRPL